MALTAYGFGQSYPPAIGARFHEVAGPMYKGQRVGEGFNVTAGPGAALTVTRGVAVMPGLFVEDTAASSVPITSAHYNKRNLLVIDADWTANSGAGAIGLTLMQGGSAFPTPTQQAGTRWQMPLARVIVGSGGAITSLEMCKPTTARAYPFLGTGDGAGEASVNSTKLLRTAVIADPGFPYWLEIKGDARARAKSSGAVAGYAELAIRFNGNPIAGTPVYLPNTTAWVDQTVFGTVRTPQSGATTVTLMGGVQTGGGLTDYQQAALYVTRHPAF